MIIAQWLYANRQGTFWIARHNECIFMDRIGVVSSTRFTDNYIASQHNNRYLDSQTNFMLEFVTV